MLEVSALVAGYGPARVIHGVSFSLGQGAALAILGRNGAGKSTTLKTLMGLLPSLEGEIIFAGHPIHTLTPDTIARLGIGYVPEDRRIFAELTVAENLTAGEKRGRSGAVAWTSERVFSLLPEIARRRDSPAGTLSGGERQMLAIGRAMMGNPELLILDEPAEGLAPVVVNRLAHTLRDLRRDGVSLLIAEQNHAMARTVAEDLIILETGHIRYSGTFAELGTKPDIAYRFLGI